MQPTQQSPRPRPAPDDEQRLAALRSYGILDTPPEPAFDDITRLLAHVCQAPVALVTFIDERRQWFKSEVGLGLRETPLDVSFCVHFLDEPDVVVVHDAAADERFRDNPLVVGEPHVRFYAEAPLESAEGHRLGALCVLDYRPRDLTDAQRDALRALARQVTAQLELRRAGAEAKQGGARLGAMLEASLDCIVGMDREGRVTEWNAAAERTFGYARAEALGREMASLIIPPALRDRHRAGLARYLATGEGPVLGRRLELSAVRKDGTEFPVELAITPIRTQGPPEFTAHLRDITEAKRLDEARRMSDERFRRLIEQSPLSTQILDPDGTTRAVNRAWEKLWGVTLADLPGYNILKDEELVRLGAMPLIQKAFAGEAVAIEPIPYVLDRGQWAGKARWCGAFVYPVKDNAGRVEEVVLVHEDVTERRQAQEALRQSEERLRAVFQQTEAGIAQVDLTGRFVLANERYAQIVGRSQDELPSLRMQDITHPDDLPSNLKLLERAVRDGTPFVVEKRYVRPDGSEVWVSNSVSLMRGADGKPSGLIAATVDVTDRRRVEEVLRESEAHARRIIDNTLAFVGVMTPDGTLTEANATALRAGGLRREDVVGRKFWDCYWWSYDGGVQARLRDAVSRAAGGEVVRYDVVVRMADDAPMPIDFMLSPVRDGQGHVTHLIPSGVDIAERKRAEGELRESEELVRTIAENSTQGMAMMDARGYCTYANRAWLDMTGYSADEIGSKPLHYLVHHHYPDGRPFPMEECPIDRALPENFDVRAHEDLFFRKDGSTFPVLVAASPIFKDGRPVSTVIEIRDVTDAKRADAERERLLESERAARVEAERASRMKDEFLATLSHELRTPLNAILGWSQLLAQGDRDGEDLVEGLRVIQRNARAQTQIIEDLLDMSRIISGKVRLDVQRIDLAAVVQAAVETVRPAAEAKGIRLQAVLDPQARPVSGDPNRLQQVFWNLLTNAVKFTPKGGRVQVLLERVNSHLEVSVIDTGEGIKPEFLPHVFDRFRQADASASRRHGGLGLGLSIAKQLVELHGGTVRAKSGGEGQGSTFAVALPLTVIHPDPEPVAERRHPDAASDGVAMDSCPRLAGVKVLVVDDEADARALVKRLLEECDAVVQTAGSVAEAMERIQTERPDVLVSDIGMPGEDGYLLIKRVRALGAGRGGKVPALALTAYARLEDRMRAVGAGYQMHVAKPVEPAELIMMVASLAGKVASDRG